MSFQKFYGKQLNTARAVALPNSDQNIPPLGQTPIVLAARSLLPVLHHFFMTPGEVLGRNQKLFLTGGAGSSLMNSDFLLES